MWWRIIIQIHGLSPLYWFLIREGAQVWIRLEKEHSFGLALDRFWSSFGFNLDSVLVSVWIWIRSLELWGFGFGELLVSVWIQIGFNLVLALFWFWIGSACPFSSMSYPHIIPKSLSKVFHSLKKVEPLARCPPYLAGWSPSILLAFRSVFGHFMDSAPPLLAAGELFLVKITQVTD